MSVRRLTAALSLVLMGHLLVAQSLLACSTGDSSKRVAEATHCHGAGAAPRSVGDGSGSSYLMARSSESVPEIPQCCALAMACGSAVFATVSDRTHAPVIDLAPQPLVALVAPLGRSIGPEPPPPK